MSPSGAPSRPGSSLIATLGVLAALDLGLFFWYLKTNIIRQPFWDMYSWVLHYLDYRASGGWWAYLWAPHDVHRPVWIRLLTAFDIEAFGGVSYPFIIPTTICHLVTAWLLWRECRRGVSGSLGQALGYIVLMFVLTSVAAVDCAIPIGNGYVHVLTLTVLAIVLFDGVGGAGSAERDAYWRGGAALVAAVSAPLASAVGWSVWPILLWIAWRSGAGRRWGLIVAVVGTAYLLFYLHGMSIVLGGGAEEPGPGSVAQAIERLNYLLTYVGLPWTRAATLAGPGRVVGAILLVAGVWAVLSRGLFRTPQGRLERIAVALIMFSLASALLASIGRTSVPGASDVLVPVRYSVLLTPLHVGFLWIATPVLSRLWSSERRQWALATGLVGASVLLLVAQVAAGQAAAANTSRMRAAIDRFVAGESDPDTTMVIYSDVGQARRELEIMQRAGVYVQAR